MHHKVCMTGDTVERVPAQYATAAARKKSAARGVPMPRRGAPADPVRQVAGRTRIGKWAGRGSLARHPPPLGQAPLAIQSHAPVTPNHSPVTHFSHAPVTAQAFHGCLLLGHLARATVENTARANLWANGKNAKPLENGGKVETT